MAEYDNLSWMGLRPDPFLIPSHSGLLPCGVLVPTQVHWRLLSAGALTLPIAIHTAFLPCLPADDDGPDITAYPLAHKLDEAGYILPVHHVQCGTWGGR